MDYDSYQYISRATSRVKQTYAISSTSYPARIRPSHVNKNTIELDDKSTTHGASVVEPREGPRAEAKY